MVLAVVSTSEAVEFCPMRPRIPPSGAATIPVGFADWVRSYIQNKTLAPCTPGAHTPSATAASISIVVDDNVEYINIGCTNVSTGTAPTEDSVYRLASVSKSFTAFGVVLALEDGKIASLDDEVRKYVPEFYVKNPFSGANGSQPTWRQLMSQMSGMQRDGPCSHPACPEETTTMLARLTQMDLILPEYYWPSYSNIGFSLLGHLVAERLYNMTYADYLQTKIVGPLGMNMTGSDFSSSTYQMYSVAAYQHGSAAPVAPLELGYDIPTGGLFSTARDLSRWLQFLMKQWQRKPLYKEMFQMLYLDGDMQTGWGNAAWETILTQQYIVRTKAGNLPGVTAVIASVPELAFGMSIQWNGDGMQDQMTTINDLFNYIIPMLVEQYQSLEKSLFPVIPSSIDVTAVTGTYGFPGIITANIYPDQPPGFTSPVLVFQSVLGTLYLRHNANASSLGRAAFQAVSFNQIPRTEYGTCWGMLHGGNLFAWLYLSTTTSGSPQVEAPSLVFGVPFPKVANLTTAVPSSTTPMTTDVPASTTANPPPPPPPTIGSTNMFYIPRQSETFCSSIDVNSTATVAAQEGEGISVPWATLKNSAQWVTSYTDSGSSMMLNVSIVAISVSGSWPGVNLTYTCPPANYNGYPGGCAAAPQTQLWAVHTDASTGNIQRIDVVRSGAPFPTPSTLAGNQPPFGVARFAFAAPGIATMSSGLLQLVPKNVSGLTCPAASLGQMLNLKGLRFSAYGYFSNNAGKSLMPSNWHMDDDRKLLVIEPLPAVFWFNNSGFFMSDSSSQCVWDPLCNYECEVYNYDSRFLDYIGTWTITGKLGFNSTQSRLVNAFLGNAIDAAGVFPCIMYMDVATGAYVGLDKFDTTPATAPTAAFYWYLQVVMTPPDFTQLAFPSSCSGSESQWSNMSSSPSSIAPTGTVPVTTLAPGQTAVPPASTGTLAPGQTASPQAPTGTLAPGETAAPPVPSTTLAPGQTAAPQTSTGTLAPGQTAVPQAPTGTLAPGQTAVPGFTLSPGFTLVPEGPFPTYDNDGEAVTIHTTRQYDLGTLRVAVQALVGADADIIIIRAPTPIQGTGGEMSITFRFVGASAIAKTSAFLALSTAALETQGITSAAPADIAAAKTGLSAGAIVGIAVAILLPIIIAVAILVTRKPSEGTGAGRGNDEDYEAMKPMTQDDGRV